MRYTVNISFKVKIFETIDDIIYDVKTLKSAMDFKNIIDDTVSVAFIKDNTNGKIIWLKE